MKFNLQIPASTSLLDFLSSNGSDYYEKMFYLEKDDIPNLGNSYANGIAWHIRLLSLFKACQTEIDILFRLQLSDKEKQTFSRELALINHLRNLMPLIERSLLVYFNTFYGTELKTL